MWINSVPSPPRLERNLAIISGGPGTGKTSIVLTLLRCLVRRHRAARVALAAPTGRARPATYRCAAHGFRSIDQRLDGDHAAPVAWLSSVA